MANKYVYLFGTRKSEGDKEMRNLLGGKGANLAEMVQLGIPVPPGFTITTEVCNWFNDHDQSYPKSLDGSVRKALAAVEAELGLKFGDATRPLLVSVRSGARASMPGMMETVLNVGLNDATCEGLIAESGDARFVYDAQRRLIQMYSDVVMEKAAGIEPEEGKGIRAQLEHELENLKEKRGVTDDTDLSADDLEALVVTYRAKVREAGSIRAVPASRSGIIPSRRTGNSRRISRSTTSARESTRRAAGSTRCWRSRLQSSTRPATAAACRWG